MLRRITEGIFSLFIFIFYKQIGTKFKTDSLKFFWDFFFVVLEKSGQKLSIISSNYMRLYDDIVEKEIDMAEISSEEKILVIGCGSLPATTALIAMKIQSEITTIDVDSKAVNEAKTFFKNHNLENEINVEHADGLNYSVDKFDVIFLLYGVKNQNKILKHIHDNVSDKTRIIFRTVCDENACLKNKSIDISKYFLIKDHVSSDYLGSVDSLLLLKKK